MKQILFVLMLLTSISAFAAKANKNNTPTNCSGGGCGNGNNGPNCPAGCDNPVLIKNPAVGSLKCTTAGGTVITSNGNTYCCISKQLFEAACASKNGMFENNPRKCEIYDANPNYTVVLYPDGNSDNSKCCVKCKGKLVNFIPTADNNKCRNGLDPIDGKCCYSTATGNSSSSSSSSSSSTSSTSSVAMRICLTPGTSAHSPVNANDCQAPKQFVPFSPGSATGTCCY